MPEIAVRLTGLSVEGVRLEVMGGSLIAGENPMERIHWAAVGVVRGAFDAPQRVVEVELTTGLGTHRGDAMIATVRTLDGAEIRTGVTAFGESVLVAVEPPAEPDQASDRE